MPEHHHDDRPPRWRRFAGWSLLAVMLAGLAAFSAFAGWGMLHSAADRALLESIDRLVLCAPTDCTVEEWEVAVYWTHNLHCNSMPFAYWQLGEIRELRHEIDRRAREQSNLALIEWIWKQYADRSSGGRRYAEKYGGPVLDREMERVVTEGDPYGDYRSAAELHRRQHGRD